MVVVTYPCHNPAGILMLFLISRDNVAWDEEQEQEAEAKVALNSSTRVEPQRQGKIWSLLNSLRAKFFIGNINIYLHFMSLLPIDMTQVL